MSWPNTRDKLRDVNTLLRLLTSAGPVFVLLLVALLKPELASNWFHATERALARLARHRGLSITLVGLLAFVASATISLLVQMPDPWGHDEFSYLLAADTFAHGRLANPPHPLWIHFESFHILYQPTYASIYPPAQGLMLAVGQVVCGLPIVGVWLSHALACATICWMLMAWMPPRWALLGGLLAVVHPTMLWWSQIYMGGSVAVFGGALLLGALRRVVEQPRPRDVSLMGLGIAVLVNSRLYEGTVLSVMCLGFFLFWFARYRGAGSRVVWPRIAAPLLLVLALTAAWMGYYNWRVTGHPLLPPYILHGSQYGVWPTFLWQHPRPEPTYHHQVMREFYAKLSLVNYEYQRSLAGVASATVKKLRILLEGAFPFHVVGVPLIVLLIPLATMPWLLKDRWMRLAGLICGGFVTALLLVFWTNVHYAAPCAGLIFVLTLQTTRHLRVWRWRGKPCGRFLVRAALLLCAVSLIPTASQLSTLSKRNVWPKERAHLLAELKRDGQRHLVIVRYSPQHRPEPEWVYNEADIDSASVVWAREMDYTQNRKLLDYFKDRRVWLLEADTKPVRLVPYPTPAGL